MSNSDAPGWPSPICSGGDLEIHTKRLEGALAKLERVMPEALRGRVRALQETISIAVGRPQAPAKSEALLALAAAVGERRRVRLRYRSGGARETEREVDPYVVINR